LCEAEQTAAEAAISTIDQSDIRGSGQARRHGRDSSGAAAD
jgi:hypothetical protein